MTEWKFTLAVIVAAVMMASTILPPGGPASIPTAATPVSAGRDAPPMRDPNINYMNKTVLTPTIDGTWGANEWTRAKRYDMSFGGQDQCVMYISYDTTNTRIFIGIDVPVDITQDTSVNENELVQIAMDGDNDGRITYKNKDGTPENETGEVMPITYGGSCKDRWAMISGSGTYDAGWLNLNGVDNSIQLWRTQPYYYEATDQMSAGFSGHRFYEYSIDYIHELGISAGASSIVGINIRVMDGLGDNNPNTWQVRGYLPFNYSTLGGPWAQFALAQAPLAGIRTPAEGRVYYQNETIVLDGSDSTDDAPASLVYAWSFDDGGTAANKTASHSFATTGRHLITLNVTDADGLTNTTRATVNIRERNAPPVIESFFPGPDQQVNETEEIMFGVNVTDENMDVGDRVNITWTIDGVVKKVDVNSWKSNFSVATQYDGPLSAGTHTIAASVVDSYDIESHDPVVHSWSLSVQNTDRPPLVIASSPDSDIITVLENAAQDFSIEFQDPDLDNFTVQWKIDNRTVPGSRDEASITYSPDYNSSGVHVLKAVATDELGGVTERIWTVTVANVNRPPRIVSFSPMGDSLQMQEGKTIMLVISPFDPDGGAPRVEWFNGDDIIEGANATAYSFKAQYEGPGSSELSPYTITAVITDKEGQKDERSWEIAVDDVNRPPVALIDEPLDDSTFRLGASIRFRADRSWDPDTVDNSSLSYTWSFDDGSRTSTLPVVSHKYEKTGNYTVRLTVRDRMTSSSVLVSVMVVAPVLSITELSLDPPEGASDGTRVTIQLRVANNGNAMATDVRIKLTVDNVLLTTLTIPQIERGDSQDVHWAWPAVAGSHVIRAALEPAADTVIGEGGNSQKEISVKARAGATSSIISLRTGLYIAGGAGAAVLLLVGLAVWSRQRKARQASQAAAPMPPAPAAPSQRIPYEQMASAPAPPAPATPLYPQFPGPAAAPAPPAYPQFPGPAPQPSALPVYPQFPGPAAPAGPLPPQSGALAADAAATGPQQSPYPAPASPAAQAQPVPPPSAPAPCSPVLGPPAQAAAILLTACPVCGEPVESGWMVCPACSTPLRREAAAAATPQDIPAAPAGQNAAEPSPEASALASSIAELMQKLNGLAIEGKDVAQAIGMLDIAESFLHTGKTEKAQQYLEKARTALSEIGN